MSHFAKLNEENIVEQVVVAEQDFIDTGALGDPSKWIQTSYNTRGGVHYSPETGEPDGGIALRKNYAGIGYSYDAARDAFIPPKPYASWVLNEDTCDWDPPETPPTVPLNEAGLPAGMLKWTEEDYVAGNSGWSVMLLDEE